MQYTRLMGIDFGDVRIGIAFSDVMKIIATAFETYKCVERKKDLIYLANLITTHDVETVIVGLPLNMNGEEGERAIITREFGKQLSELANVPVIFYDERLSSVEAEQILIESKVRREDRKKIIDKLAAQIILQSYLDDNARRG